MLDWRQNEIQTLADAIAEMGINELDALQFSSVTNSQFFEAESGAAGTLRTRNDWRKSLAPIAIMPTYQKWNEMQRDAKSLAFRAIVAHDYVSMILETAEAKKAIPNPKSILVQARDEIIAQLGDPIRRLCRTPFRGRFSQLILAAPELSNALMNKTRGCNANAYELLDAVEAAIKQRGLDGRPPDRSRSDAYQILREHYSWLTGRRPRWTNAFGVPEGDYVDFARSVYTAAGISQITHLMLRPARARRGPRRKADPKAPQI